MCRATSLPDDEDVPHYEDDPPFAELLPHGLLLDPESGVLLLSTARLGTASLALGCAWGLVPRNVEVCDASVCLDMAQRHEQLTRSLPVGSALQVLLTLRPASTVARWEGARQHAQAHPVVVAQRQAIHQGLSIKTGACRGACATPRRCVPCGCLFRISTRLLVACSPPPWTSQRGMVVAWRRVSRRILGSIWSVWKRCVRAGVDETLRGAGHGCRGWEWWRSGNPAVALAPLGQEAPGLSCRHPPQEQVLQTEAHGESRGLDVWATDAAAARRHVLSLHRAPPRTYPGSLVRLVRPRGPSRWRCGTPGPGH